jgi:K+ transporter
LVRLHRGGLYNFIKFDSTIVKAINPKYIVDYFRRNKKEAWISLGGTVLAITALTGTVYMEILLLAFPINYLLLFLINEV